MRRSLRLRFVVCLMLSTWSVLVVNAESRADSPSAVATEATSIFNGEDLTGWSGDPRLWSVRGGVIHGETTPQTAAKGNTFLIWNGTVDDFELRLMYRCSATNNSGIQYRSKHITDGSAKNDWVVRGYQHELRNELNFPNIAGFIYDEGGKRKRVCMVGQRGEWVDGKLEVSETFVTESQFQELFRLDDWNEVVIRCEGKNIKHFLNGELILDFTDSDDQASLSGVLALQLHAGKPMFAEFKDITLKPLD